MSSLVADNTMAKPDSSKDLHYFIACIIPFLPLIDEKEDDDDKEIKTFINDNKDLIQSDPTYVTNKLLFGTKKGTAEYVINFDDIVMRMIHIYLKKIKIREDKKGDGKKGGRKKVGRKKVGGGLKDILNDKKEMFAILQAVFGIFLLYIGISKFIDVQNRTIISTSTFTTVTPSESHDMSTALALTGDTFPAEQDEQTALTMMGIDMDTQIMFPKINLAPAVHEQITSITVKDFIKGALGFESNIYANSLIIFEKEATKQGHAAYTEILEKNLPIIKREAVEKFLDTTKTDVELEMGDFAEIEEEVFQQINQMSLTDRIFNYYKFSVTGRMTDLVRATKSAVSNFKIRVRAELDIAKDNALYKAESFIIDTLRDVVTSGRVILVGLGLLCTAYATLKADKIAERTGLAEFLEWDKLTPAQKVQFKTMLRKLHTELKNTEIDTTPVKRSDTAELMDGLGGGRKRRRKKTRRKRRKTRRKSKKRKTKRRRKRKRKTKRRKRRR